MSKTVLIADDSAMRLSVRLLLQGRHTELVVREAIDGLDDIEKAEKSKPDLILLDLAMPRLNGVKAATVFEERYAGNSGHPIYYVCRQAL